MIGFDFDKDEIRVRQTTDKVGPYRFQFAAWLPSARTISSVTVRSYLKGVESSQYLLDPATALLNTTDVDVYVQWPDDGQGTDFKGRHRLVFEFVFDDASTDEAHFDDVLVQGR